MKRIALVTGATGGIGEEFVSRIEETEEVDEIWAVGRNKEKLEKLCKDHGKVRAVEADLANDGIECIKKKLSSEEVDVKILVNNAGVAYMGLFENMKPEEIDKFIKVNCTVPAELISVTLPYMNRGARIINISSASSFQPNPYLSLYSSSKVFLRNLSRAVNVELKAKGITSTAVCPGFVDTGMLPETKDGKKIRYAGLISAKKVVKLALHDSKRGKDMSVPGFSAKYFRCYSKITPTSIVMKQWCLGVKKYL